MRAGKSLKKSVDLEGRVCWGTRASEEMVAMMPRWLGVETNSLKASWSSFETVIPDCMVPTLLEAFWFQEAITVGHAPKLPRQKALVALGPTLA